MCIRWRTLWKPTPGAVQEIVGHNFRTLMCSEAYVLTHSNAFEPGRAGASPKLLAHRCRHSPNFRPAIMKLAVLITFPDDQIFQYVILFYCSNNQEITASSGRQQARPIMVIFIRCWQRYYGCVALLDVVCHHLTIITTMQARSQALKEFFTENHGVHH